MKCVAEGHWFHGPNGTEHDPDEGPCEYAPEPNEMWRRREGGVLVVIKRVTPSDVTIVYVSEFNTITLPLPDFLRMYEPTKEP